MKTRAIIAVHFGGYLADMNELTRISNKKKKVGAYLIKDVAYAHGLKQRSRKVEAIVRMYSFGFQESKLLTAKEGEIVLNNDDELTERIMLIYNIGKVVNKPGYIHYSP